MDKGWGGTRQLVEPAFLLDSTTHAVSHCRTRPEACFGPDGLRLSIVTVTMSMWADQDGDVASAMHAMQGQPSGKCLLRRQRHRAKLLPT